MIIKPENSTSKCGILNKIYHMKNASLLYFIPENAYASCHENHVQTLVDCNVDSDWPSAKGKKYFTINLYQHIIKPSTITITRRNNFAYPAAGVLEGMYLDKWREICNLKFSFSSPSQTITRTCRSNKFYNNFRLRQTSGNDDSYLEIHSFDVFGEFLHVSEYLTARIKRCTRYSFILFSFVMITAF